MSLLLYVQLKVTFFLLDLFSNNDLSYVHDDAYTLVLPLSTLI